MSELDKVLVRIKARCDVEQVDDPCWLWRSKQRATPVMRFKGKTISVRRVIAHLQGRVELQGQYRRTVPTCENPRCVAPHHVDVVTPSASIKRAMARTGAPARRAIKVALAKRKTAKLNQAAVEEMRASPLPSAHYAKLYGVTVSAINNARSGRTWKHLASNPWAGLF